jgi:hypothetical protein
VLDEGCRRALASQWEVELRRLAEAFGEMAGTPPNKMYLALSGSFMPPEDTRAACAATAVPGMIGVALWRAQDVRRDTVPGKPGQTRLRAHGESAFIYLDVNRYRSLELDESWMDDRPPEAPLQFIYQTGEIQGFPVYNDTVLVITPPLHVPAYVPAPLGRSLRAWIAYLESQVKAMQRTHKPGADPISDRMLASNEERLGSARSMLSSLDPTGQDAPSFWSDSDSQVLAEERRGSRPIMIPNPAYFNSKLPRSSPQLLQVQVKRFDLSRPASGDPDSPLNAERALLENADWQRIAAMLK